MATATKGAKRRETAYSLYDEMTANEQKAYFRNMLATLYAIQKVAVKFRPEAARINTSTITQAEKDSVYFQLGSLEAETLGEQINELNGLAYPVKVKYGGTEARPNVRLHINTPRGESRFILDDLFIKIAEYEQQAKGKAERYTSPDAPRTYREVDAPDSETSKSILRNAYRDALRKGDAKTRKILEDRYGFSPFMDAKTKRVSEAMGLKAQRRDLKGLTKLQRQRSNRSTLAKAFTAATSSINSNTEMNTTDKQAFMKRMADARAKKAKEGGTLKKAKSARKSTAKKKATSAAAKPKTTAAKPKKSTTTKAKTSTTAKPKKKSTGTTTRRKSTVKAKATGVKKAQTARRKTATKKATQARTTARVASAKQQKGKNFILQVDKLAGQIHEKSATGRTIEVPVYRVSRSQAKKQAFKALSTARGAKNITNIRFKTA